MDVPASPPTFSFPRITRRRRHTNTGASPQAQATPASGVPSPAPQAPATTNPIPALSINPIGQPSSQPQQSQAPPGAAPPSIPPHLQQEKLSYRIRLVPHLESARSLHFEPIVRDVLVGGPPLRVGRFTDRASHPPRGNGLNPNDRHSDKVAFRSKVVSRAHAELWVQGKGMFFLKDTKSSSGTFINHMRLSPPGQESVAHILKDGDIIQLGVDYQGGTEEMYRCVKIKVEVGQGREWQGGANPFNTAALKQLRTLQAGEAADASNSKAPAKKNVGDCCICLFPVSVCQSLFIAPCSHAFHYKCIRPMLELHHPGFSCPLCRTFADLEADVEVDEQELKAIADALDEAEEEADDRGPAAIVSPNYFPQLKQSTGAADDAIDVDLDEAPPPPAARNGSLDRRPIQRGAILGVLNPTPTGKHHSRPAINAPEVRDAALEDDRLVEDALEVEYDGEEEDGDERMANGSPDEFGARGADDGNETFSPTRRGGPSAEFHGAGPSAPRTIPLRVASPQANDADSQADREAREFANATTPLNNTFNAMANSLLGTMDEPHPAPGPSGYVPTSTRNPFLPATGQHVGDDDDDAATGTEAENGHSTIRPAEGRPPARATESSSGSNRGAPSGNTAAGAAHGGASGLNGGGGTLLAKRKR